jgi:Fe-S-cluster containining protein
VVEGRTQNTTGLVGTMSPNVASKTVEAVRALYAAIDANIARSVPEAGHKVSCKKDCPACCHLVTTSTRLEALVVASNLLKKPDWKAMLPALRASAQAMSVVQHTDDYAKKKHPCAFLKNKECGIYADRPAVCRYYFVISPPENCDASLGIREVQTIDCSEALASIFSVNQVVFGEETLAPFPLQVLHALRMAAPEEDKEMLDQALNGLVDPVRWWERERGISGEEG